MIMMIDDNNKDMTNISVFANVCAHKTALDAIIEKFALFPTKWRRNFSALASRYSCMYRFYGSTFDTLAFSVTGLKVLNSLPGSLHDQAVASERFGGT